MNKIFFTDMIDLIRFLCLFSRAMIAIIDFYTLVCLPRTILYNIINVFDFCEIIWWWWLTHNNDSVYLLSEQHTGLLIICILFYATALQYATLPNKSYSIDTMLTMQLPVRKEAWKSATRSKMAATHGAWFVIAVMNDYWSIDRIKVPLHLQLVVAEMNC